ncbi:MAG TPA: MAPEG family protein [Phenylobacterium sp.]|jgi:uncharacterized MAPEG superfamily protein|nr:MAPEG family protein [Phenylobacterium sp.]
MNVMSTTEVKLLIAMVIIGLLHLVWATIAGSGGHRDTAWLLGPRDDPRPVTGQAARLSRSYANFLETFPLFAVAVIAVLMAGKTGSQSQFGAWMYVIGRVAYTPLYALGLPIVRTLAWTVSMVGIVLVIVAFFQ